MLNDRIRNAKETLSEASQDLWRAQQEYLYSRGWVHAAVRGNDGMLLSKKLDCGREIILNDMGLAVKIQSNIDGCV